MDAVRLIDGEKCASSATSSHCNRIAGALDSNGQNAVQNFRGPIIQQLLCSVVHPSLGFRERFISYCAQ